MIDMEKLSDEEWLKERKKMNNTFKKVCGTFIVNDKENKVRRCGTPLVKKYEEEKDSKK